MSKGNFLNSLNLFYGILFCLSISALVIACLAFTKKVHITPPPKMPPPTITCKTPAHQSPIYWIPRFWGIYDSGDGASDVGLSEEDQNTLEECADLEEGGGITQPEDCEKCAKAWNILARDGVAWKSKAGNDPSNDCPPLLPGQVYNSCRANPTYTQGYANACVVCADTRPNYMQ